MLDKTTIEKLDVLNLEGYNLIQKAYQIFDQMQEILAQERKASKQQEETH